jgi:hypothetical protein
MSYTPKFTTKVIVAEHPAIKVEDISDNILKRAENRVISDIRRLSDMILGHRISYTDLLACDNEHYSCLLQDAATYATISALNRIGIGVGGAGPVTHAAGDGMSISYGYYTNSLGKSPYTRVTPEDSYLAIMSEMMYDYKNGPCTSYRKPNQERYNENYDQEFYYDDVDERFVEGNEHS